MSWHGCVVAALLFSLMQTLSPPSERAKLANCTRQQLSKVESPGGAWIAAVVREVCSDGAFITTVTNNVQISSTTQPARKADVFAMDDHGYPEDQPAITWMSAKKLRITVRHEAEIGLYPPQSFGQVSLELKINPEDPALRRRIFKRLGLPPPEPQAR